jgi:hypothetical protein
MQWTMYAHVYRDVYTTTASSHPSTDPPFAPPPPRVMFEFESAKKDLANLTLFERI